MLSGFVSLVSGLKANQPLARHSICHCKQGGRALNKLGYILLVDDNQDDMELTQRALTRHKLANEIVVLRDGEEALDYLYHRGDFVSRNPAHPIVVLLDVKMPKIDGIKVLQTMKSDPTLQSIPVVMLTSSRQGPDVDECYRLGANAYVVKPVDFQQFTEAVKTIGMFWAVINQASPPS
jgi:CheY-like chemotaxis protein